MKNTHFLTALVFLGLHSVAFPWGSEGHQIVGAVAQARVTPQPVKDKIAAILGTEDLKTVATWPDDIKKIKPSEIANPDAIQNAQHRALVEKLAADPDSVAFVNKFNVVGNTGGWHFCDLPVGAKGYNDPPMPLLIGNEKNPDVVMAINKCISVLQDAHAEIHGAFGKHNALRMLVHLVGDIHQPLHVGCSYIANGSPDAAHLLIKEPTADVLAKRLKSDVGGNMLFFLPTVELHAYWDDDLVKLAVNAATEPHSITTYIKKLKERVPEPGWDSTVPVVEWSSVWATDSLQQAKLAYGGVVATDIHKKPFVTEFGPTEGYSIEVPANYPALMTPIADTQLAKAGFRLARLLNAIFSN
jgi:hypothetical protein